MNASDNTSDMNFNLELEVDNTFRFATSDKEIKTLKVTIDLQKIRKRAFSGALISLNCT